jgi:hypothetical protein
MHAPRRAQRKPAYLECGFTLVHNKSAVTDWKEVAKIGTPDNMAYRAEMEKAIRALHPDVAEFVWVAFLLRGGPGEKCARPRQRSKNAL